MPPLYSISAVILLLGLSRGSAVARAQAPADSIKLAPETPARARANDLGPGWHDGRVARISVTNGAECLGFAPTVKERIAGMTLDSVDSLEVRATRAKVDTPAGSHDPVHPDGEWIGV